MGNIVKAKNNFFISSFVIEFRMQKYDVFFHRGVISKNVEMFFLFDLYINKALFRGK